MSDHTTFHQQVIAGDYDSHVLPFLWMRGEDHVTIAAYLSQIAAADIREVCLESRPHPDFCGPRWWDDLVFVIDECKRLGMKVWILDDAHFPTGGANGAVKTAPAELHKQVLTHRTLDVVGPTPSVSISLANPLDPTEQFYGVAFWQDEKPVDVVYRVVADADGSPSSIVFDAPDGLMQVCLLFISQKTAYNPDYINMVDKASCDLLIETVYEAHFERFSGEFGKTILGFFSDEPGFANEKGSRDADGNADSLIGKARMPLPWSRELERRLKDALGDGYLQELPGLWTRSSAGAHVRFVYMDIATRLYQECFCDNVGSWCRDHGVAYIGHVIEDKDGHARLGVGVGHYFRAVAGQDMAGVDVVINQLVPGMDHGFHNYLSDAWDLEFYNYALPKLGSSAARLDPKKAGRCVAEVFGAFGWHEGMREMKWIADHFLVRGVNWFVPHAFSMAKFPDSDCPPHFYAQGNNAQFRHFGKLMRYLNRMGTLLSGGIANTPVAVLYHADAEWAGAAMPIQRVASRLTRSQIDFDFVPAEAFSDDDAYQIELTGDGFAINGQHYRALVVPRREYVGADFTGFVYRASKSGVPVLFVDALPTSSYNAALENGAFEGCETIGLDMLAARLADAGLQTVVTSEAQPWLRTYRYEHSGETYFMFVNEHPKRHIDTQVSLPDSSALTGVSYDVLNEGEGIAFGGRLELAPYESVLVVAEASTGTPRSELVACGSVEGPWTVSFGRETRELDALVDLTSTVLPGTAGTYRYKTVFTVRRTAGVTLDLGSVYETAEVWVDGMSCGARIVPPYRFGLGTLDAGEHELIVDVTNTLDHKVDDFFALYEAHEPSGLIGPVTILQVR